MNEGTNQPRSLADYIAQTGTSIIVDQATGLGFPASVVQEQQAQPAENVESNPNAGEGQGAGQPGAEVTTQQMAPDPEMEALRSRLKEAEQAQEATRQLLLKQAEAARKAELAHFQQSLEGLDETEKEARLLRFENQRLANNVQVLSNQLQQVNASAEEAKQAVAKRQVAHILANQHGLPPEYAPILMQAQTPEQMQFSVQFLANQYKAQKQAEQATARKEMAENPAFRPTGDNVPAAVAEGPKKRSGDLQGLFATRNYQLGN